MASLRSSRKYFYKRIKTLKMELRQEKSFISYGIMALNDQDQQWFLKVQQGVTRLDGLYQPDIIWSVP